MIADREPVISAVDKIASTIEEVGLTLWKLSEPSLLELKSSAYLKDILKSSGFTITGEGSGGVPTAFIAEFGSGKPILGIMLEYDSLPGLGNEAVPYKQPREDGTTVGHGCGHNLIGAGALGAALALKNLMAEKSVAGTLRVYGGASEETEGAKVYMARDGLFNDLDACLHWHPIDGNAVANVRTSAQQQIYIEFAGKSAHAGQSPWLGRSALHAVELFLHAVNTMREQLRPTARVHYVVRDGGVAPNIIPDKGSVQLTFREETRQYVEDGVEWIKQMAEGAALMTQTKALAVPFFGMYDLLPNTPLAERMQSHFEAVGVPQYTAEEQEFAKSLQQAVGLEPKGMASTVLPLFNAPTTGGSTDVGDISWLTPTMGLVAATVPVGIALHSWMATASHGTSIATKAAITAAKVLALTGADVMIDAEFRQQVRGDFEKRTEGFVYKSPLPDILKEPVGLPNDMRRHESVADLKAVILNQTEDHQLAPRGHVH